MVGRLPHVHKSKEGQKSWKCGKADGHVDSNWLVVIVLFDWLIIIIVALIIISSVNRHFGLNFQASYLPRLGLQLRRWGKDMHVGEYFWSLIFYWKVLIAHRDVEKVGISKFLLGNLYHGPFSDWGWRPKAEDSSIAGGFQSWAYFQIGRPNVDFWCLGSISGSLSSSCEMEDVSIPAKGCNQDC